MDTVLADHISADPWASHRGVDPAHDRGLQGLRHHLCHDAWRTGGFDQDGQLLRLPGILQLSARRQRRGIRAGRDHGERCDDRHLHHAAAPAGEGVMERPPGLIVQILTYTAVVVLAVTTIAPLLWLFIMSISSQKDLTSLPLHWIPDQADFSRYQKLLTVAAHSAGEEFVYALRNSLGAALGASAIALLAGIPAAYSFS